MKRLLSLLTTFILATVAFGESGDIIPPQAIYKVTPTHPDELYKEGLEGSAVIIATIDMFGTVKNPTVDSATHEEFGIAAMFSTAEWIFDPATRNGVPIEVKIRLPFEFKLKFEHRINIEVGRDVYKKITEPIVQSTDLDIAPIPRHVPAFADFYPEHFKGTGEKASISVEFTIGLDGNVHNPLVLSTSNPAFREAAIRAISRMKYNPIRHQGLPSYVSMKRPIQMSE